MTEVADLEPEELPVIETFVKIRRFEKRIRRFLLDSLNAKYGNETEERVKRTLGADYNEIRERNVKLQRLYGRPLSAELSLSELFENLGFEHYSNFLGDANYWQHCFSSCFSSQADVLGGLNRIRDARNEIMHNRDTIHPNLRAACALEIDSILGQIEVPKPELVKLIAIVHSEE